MHDDYSDQYITNLIDRLNQQIEDTSTIRILTTYLDFTEQEAKDALAMLSSQNLTPVTITLALSYLMQKTAVTSKKFSMY